MATEDIKVPDIGDFDSVPIIEIHVAEGDTVSPEDPLVTLESDKAAMDVPSPAAFLLSRRSVRAVDLGPRTKDPALCTRATSRWHETLGRCSRVRFSPKPRQLRRPETL